jgi:hypothetical protein
MTNRATRARLRFAGADRFRDAGGARIEQDSVSPRVKVLPGPSDILAAFLARPAVAAGGLTADGPDKARTVFPDLLWFFRRRADQLSSKENADQKRAQPPHAPRLTLCAAEIPR